MGFVRIAALKDLRRYMRDPLGLLLWLAIPLLIGGMITLATGGSSGVQTSARVLVADEDDSFLSRFLVGAFGQAGGESPVRAETVEPEEGRTRIEAGEATALLLIPKGFGDAVLREQPMQLTLITNPAQRILPGIVQGMLEAMVDGVFYLHRIFGPQLREIIGPTDNQSTLSDAEIGRISVEISRTMRQLERYLSPPAIDVETSVDENPGREISAAVLFFPGIILMALVFMSQGLSEDVWKERHQGTLRRMISASGGVTALLTGKLMASLLLLSALSFVILIIGMIYLSISLAKLPLALAWSACTGGVFFLLMTLIQLHASSQRAGSILITSIVFPLLMVGGSFFPSEAMPGWMATVGGWTPNGWALERLKDIFLDRADPVTIAAGFAAFLALAAALLLLGSSRMRRGFAGA